MGYKAIAEEIRSDIRSGDFPAGQYLPTERELQNRFGASRSTIRRALADVVAQGYGESVPSRGVLVSSSKAAETAASRMVALIDQRSTVSNALFRQLGSLVREQGLQLIHLGGDAGTFSESLNYVAESGFAGAFLWPYEGYPDCEVFERARKRMALVLLDHAARGISADLATVDYFDAAYQATRQLIRTGHREIGVAGMFDMLSTTHDRFSGYMKAMFDHGLQPRPENYIFTFTSGLDEPTTELLRIRMRMPDAPDAWFVMQDDEVAPLVETALALGKTLPDDIAVATIGDDIDISVDGLGLTATATDWRGMAVEAVRLLMRRLENPGAPLETRVLQSKLIIRGLCGADPTQWHSFGPGESIVRRKEYRFISRMPAKEGRIVSNPTRNNP